MNQKQPDYLTNFIINAGRLEFETSDGEKRYLRQPTPEEAADGDSAYRIAYRRVLDDARLRELAENEEELKREARVRGAGAEAMYMMPLLLEDERGNPLYDVHSETSLAEFETMDPAIAAELAAMYLGPLVEAINEAKKKSVSILSTGSRSASNSANGRSQTRRKR
jgi:hypothetical protein